MKLSGLSANVTIFDAYGEYVILFRLAADSDLLGLGNDLSVTDFVGASSPERGAKAAARRSLGSPPRGAVSRQAD